MRRFAGAGFAAAVELGPGAVLKGLMRAIEPAVQVLSVGDPVALESALNQLAAARQV